MHNLNAHSALSDRDTAIRIVDETELSQLPACNIVQLTVHLRDVASVLSALPQLIPRKPLTATANNPLGIWMAPNRWLLLSESVSAQEIVQDIEQSLTGGLVFSALDVSSAWTGMSICGSQAVTALSSGCGLDLRHETFVAVCCARTRFADVPLIIHRPGAGSRYDLYVDRAYAPHIWAWLANHDSDQ